MEPPHLPKETLLGEIAYAKRPVSRPMLRFKDVVKRDMISFDIGFFTWEHRAEHRDQWRKTVSDVLKMHDKTWLETLA